MHLISFSWTLKQFKKQSEKSWLMEYLECNIYNNTFHNKLIGVQILPESQLSDEISIQEKEVWWNKKNVRLYNKMYIHEFSIH